MPIVREFTAVDLIDAPHVFARFSKINVIANNSKHGLEANFLLEKPSSYLEQRAWTDVSGIFFVIREKFISHSDNVEFNEMVQRVKRHLGEKGLSVEVDESSRERRQVAFTKIDDETSIGD